MSHVDQHSSVSPSLNMPAACSQDLKSESRPVDIDLQCVAYYLGQFHRIDLNDHYWGRGFTEWHNVAKARPLYPGHSQPKIPGDLGFYDLRCTDTLRDQIAYSHESNVTGFCYWHYWFAGKRLLHQPLDSMLKLRYPGFKFMLGWANESWSGVWHGASDTILMAQTYNAQELLSHAKVIAEYIETGDYLTVNGKSPFVIYRPKQIPRAVEYLARLREAVNDLCGSELYIIGNWFQGRSCGFGKPSDYGLDAAVITPVAPPFQGTLVQGLYSGIWEGLRKLHIGPEVRRYDHVSSTLQRAMASIQGTAHATIVTGWDNTPRSGRRGLVLAGYNEDTFRRAAAHAVTLERANATRLLFVKSWNEWAEGNTLEPIYHETWSAGAVLREVLRGR